MIDKSTDEIATSYFNSGTLVEEVTVVTVMFSYPAEGSLGIKQIALAVCDERGDVEFCARGVIYLCLHQWGQMSVMLQFVKCQSGGLRRNILIRSYMYLQ